MEFSKESKLLVEHWDTFQDAMRAYERLEDEEIPELLQWIKSSVEAADWSEGWKLRGDNRSNIVYFNPDWVGKDTRVVDVGKYNLPLSNFFDPENPPRLHVMVWKFYPELMERLLQEIEDRGLLTIGEPDYKGNTVTIIEMPLPTCPPASPADLAQAIHDGAIEFFSHYLPVVMQLGDLIQNELEKYSEA